MLDRVPLELLAGPQGDRADVADDYRPTADQLAGNRLLATADAVDEVLHVIGRPRWIDHLGIGFEWLRQKLGVAREQIAAADKDLALLADDQETVLAGTDLALLAAPAARRPPIFVN